MTDKPDSNFPYGDGPRLDLGDIHQPVGPNTDVPDSDAGSNRILDGSLDHRAVPGRAPGSVIHIGGRTLGKSYAREVFALSLLQGTPIGEQMNAKFLEMDRERVFDRLRVLTDSLSLLTVAGAKATFAFDELVDATESYDRVRDRSGWHGRCRVTGREQAEKKDVAPSGLLSQLVERVR